MREAWRNSRIGEVRRRNPALEIPDVIDWHLTKLRGRPGVGLETINMHGVNTRDRSHRHFGQEQAGCEHCHNPTDEVSHRILDCPSLHKTRERFGMTWEEIEQVRQYPRSISEVGTC